MAVVEGCGPFGAKWKKATTTFLKWEYCYVFADMLEWAESGRGLTFIHLRPPFMTARPRCH